MDKNIDILREKINKILQKQAKQQTLELTIDNQICGQIIPILHRFGFIKSQDTKQEQTKLQLAIDLDKLGQLKALLKEKELDFRCREIN